MSWSVQIFRLVSSRSDPGLFCTKDQLTLGGQPLLNMTSLGFRPLPLGQLQQVFDAAYGVNASIDAASRFQGLLSIARALNAGDLSYAAMLSLMLRLPEIDLSGMSRLRQLSGTSVGKYDDAEDRDQRGRWTSGRGQSSLMASKPMPSRASASTGTAQRTATQSTGRWPDKHLENPNIVPAQGVIPFPLLPPMYGGGATSPKPKDDDLYPPFIPDTSAGSQANSSATSNANSSATTDAYATTDNKPRSCPDSSYEPGSDKRTREQLLYQAQINGLPFGYEVVLNGVGYDGCRESDNTMLEAKHIGPWFIYIREDYFKKMHEYEDIKDQGFRQNYSSGGRKVEWHFDDPQVANYWRNEFTKLKYDNITVKYTAYNPLYNPNIDKMLLALCGVR